MLMPPTVPSKRDVLARSTQLVVGTGGKNRTNGGADDAFWAITSYVMMPIGPVLLIVVAAAGPFCGEGAARGR